MWLPSSVGLLLAEQTVMALVAIGLLTPLFEGALIELFQTERADKMLRVKLFEHCSDAPARDGLLAARAQRAAQ